MGREGGDLDHEGSGLESRGLLKWDDLGHSLS